MSYRNPPIIVDRSGDVWAKAISGFAEQLSNGVIKYSEARKAEIEATKKSKQAMQSFSSKTRESYSDALRDEYIAIKKKNGNVLAEKFKAEATTLMDGDGKNIGAIDASTQLKFNLDLSSEQRSDYEAIVNNYKDFQAQMTVGASNIKTGVENVKSQRVNGEGNPGGYAWKGKNNIERFKTQVAYNAFDEESMISPETIEEYDFNRGENGENFVTTNTFIPVEDLDNGPFSEYLTPEELGKIETVEKNDKKYYKFNFKRDANVWDGEFINDLSPLPEYSQSYNVAGLEDKNGDITAKYSSNVTIVNNDKGEKYNQDIVNLTDIKSNNVLYAEMMGEAAAILEGTPEEIQANLQFGTNRSTLTYSSFLKENPDLNSQKKFIADALVQNSIDTRFSQYLPRTATSEDVQALKLSNPNTSLSIGDDILYKTIKTDEIKQPKEEKLTEGAIKRKITNETAKTVLNDMLESPKSYFKDRRINGKKVSDVRILPSTVGEGGEKEGRILEIGYESGTSTKGGERTIFTDEMTFDLDDPVRVRTLIDLLPEGDALKTALKKLTVNTGNLPITKK